MSKIDNKTIASIKVLALDMIDKAKSGHPGIVLSAAPILYALYKDCIDVIPGKPEWINRDRFVLSAGHGSALLYSMLYHAGFDIDIEELKHYRDLNSLAPGHPEVRVTSGVDVSTGLLGEGIANAVGIAFAERYFRSLINKEKPKSKLIDYHTYCLCSDGDLQEGVAYEALSFAGTQNLNKLILLYDCNKISLDGEIDVTFTEDVEIRFEALDFNVIRIKKGNNHEEIADAIDSAKKSKRPSIIIIETVLGKDSIYENTNKTHGKPLEKEDLK
ncbi:MAG: transketolase, partial [Bacilli bacterium]|nr:transketolase [Bacilli bacterium]